MQELQELLALKLLIHFLQIQLVQMLLRSGTIQDLLQAGTDVYLRANQDITVSDAISVSGSSGDLSLLAGRDITINSNITTIKEFNSSC